MLLLKIGDIQSWLGYEDMKSTQIGPAKTRNIKVSRMNKLKTQME